MGKVVKPGRSVLVDAARLEGATKVAKEVKVGHLYIGDVLPAEYTNQKKPPRAIADARIVGANGKPTGEKVEVAQGHGQFSTEAAVADMTAKVEETFSEVPMEEKQEGQEESSYSYEGGRNKKHRR
jgi:hypothetical protein